MATALAVMTAFAVSAASASAEVVYNNIPATLPGNFASVGPEAYSYVEFGGQMELAGMARNKPTVEVVMSSWGCQYGTWYDETCETPQPTKKFKWPLTLKIYEVGEHNLVGEQLAEATKTFAMPYRPSDDKTHCTGGRWYQASTSTCFHGEAFTVKFPTLKVLRLPRRVIIGISYNTSDHGPSPVGQSTACFVKSAGCYYDSLNIGLAEPSEHLLTTGLAPVEPYIESTYGELTCNNAALASEFGPSECNSGWEGDQPLIRITAH